MDPPIDAGSVQPPSGRESKNQSLEGLRGIAALGVVLAHFLFAFLPYLAHYHSRGAAISQQRFVWGNVASWPIFTVLYNGAFQVGIFFVLSGYVLTHRAISSGQFDGLIAGALKRYPRLIIPAFLSCIFAWTLLQTGMMHTDLSVPLHAAGWVHNTYAEPKSLKYAIFQGLIGAPLFGQTYINDPLWTIRVEFLGSLLLFVCYGFCGSKNPLLACVLFVAFSVVICNGSRATLYYLSLLVGSLINYATRGTRRPSPKWLGAIAVLGLAFGAADYSPPFLWYQNLLASTGIAPDSGKVFSRSVGAILLVYALVASPRGRAARALGSAVPAWLGKISFSMYLVHWPVICSVGYVTTFVAWKHFDLGYGKSLLVSGLLVLLVVFVVSHFFTKYVDQPSMQVAQMMSLWGMRAKGAAKVRLNRKSAQPFVKIAVSMTALSCLLLLAFATQTVAAYTDPINGPLFSRISTKAPSCTSKRAAMPAVVKDSEVHIVIAMYGDATMQGLTNRDGESTVIADNPPALLGEAFCREKKTTQVVTVNLAVAGITTADLLYGRHGVRQSWNDEMSQSDADIVVINTGLNDARLAGLDTKAFAVQYIDLIRIARHYGKAVVVESANPVDRKFNAALWSVAHVQRDVADRLGVTFVDQWAAIQKSTPTWRALLSDGVYPGDQMYRLKASNEYRVIDPLVAPLLTQKSVMP